MNQTVAPPLPLSLNALRDAVGGVVDAGDCWDRLVCIWRIMRALDGLMAVLWAIVHRLRAGETPLGVGCPVVAARDERPVIAGSGPVRLRAVAGVRAMPGRRVLTTATASAGRVQRGWWRRVDWGWRDRALAGTSPVLASRGRRFSESGWDASQSCVLIVPVC